jgi:hypothetical protein
MERGVGFVDVGGCAGAGRQAVQGRASMADFSPGMFGEQASVN